MPAIIRSLRNGITPVIGASRDDLVAGDVVAVNSVGTHTTYSWSLAYRPPGSTAAFSGSAANPSPGSFTVDVEGPYLVRLIADLGLATESEQFVRLRYLTVFGDLRLVSAGEQYGGAVNVPVDIAFTGWADEQNYNLTTILGFVARVSSSGRLLYVDANASTEGHGDYATIQAALDYAAATASPTTPWVVAVRPGTYTEDLTLRPNVHVVAWPGSGSSFANTSPVLVRGVHTLSLPNVADTTVLSGITALVHVGTTNPGLDKSGVGTLVVSDCLVAVGASTPTQGPAIRLTSGPMSAYRSNVQVAPANPVTVFAVEQLAGRLTLYDCDLRAPSGILVPATAPTNTATEVWYTRVTATGGIGASAIRTDASDTSVRYSVLSASPGPAILVHPGAGAYAGSMSLDVQWSSVSGTVSFDTTGIAGAATLDTGAVSHGGFVFPGVPPTLAATVRADSVSYDNTVSGLTATDAQAAIDELVGLLAPFTAGYTLEQAYNGGGPGAGRTVVADSGAVQILDAAFPSDPVPAGNTNGNLEVVGKVSVGALTKPEVDVDPNPYGTGPRISMGWTVVPNNSPTGVGTATVVARSTEAPLYRNYDLRLGTQPASGGGRVGDVVVRAGDGTQGGGTTPDAGSVYVLAGSGLDGIAARGNVLLAPGVNFAGGQGAVVVVDPRSATPASVTAAGVCSNPVGVTGTITFATDLGAATASINAGDTLAVAATKLNALLGLSASVAAGIITVSSRTTGPSARVYFLSASAGLDAALGTFDGQPMVSGTYPDFVAVQATAANEVTFGANGVTGPLVYNADTGKLTVPGLIDPTGVVFEEAAAPGTGATEGAVFVSDGTGGLTLGDLYYQGPGSAPPVSIGGGGGAGPLQPWARLATTGNVVLLAGGAPSPVDGFVPSVGDRILVWQQSVGSQNGIYEVSVVGTGSNGTWTRVADAPAGSTTAIIPGTTIFVSQGSDNGQTRVVVTNTGVVTIGTTAITFLQEAPLVRTDATSTAIIAAGTAFTAGTIVWSSALDTRDYSEVSVWFGSANIGANTQVDLYVQWSDDGTTIPFGDDDGIQQTDFLITTGSTGIFQPKDYVARLTTAGGELVVGSIKMLSFPKKGGSMRFGVMGNSATGTFGVRAQRLA